AANNPGAPKAQQNLLDVVAGKPFLRRDVTASHRTFVRAARQMERTDDAVLGERSNAHGLKLADGWRIRNGERPDCSAARRNAMRSTGHADLGHFLEIEHFVDLVFGNDLVALDHVANENALLHRLLADLGRARVTDLRGE